MAGISRRGLIAITDDNAGVAEHLAQCLCSNGIDARVVRNIPHDATGIIFLGGLALIHDETAAVAVLREAVMAAKSIAKNAPLGPKLLVTVQDTGGDFGLNGTDPTRAYLGGLAGLAKTARHEWPGASVKAIDLERGERSPLQLAQALERELLSGGAEIETGLHANGERTTLQSYADPIPKTASARVPDENSVFVVSGGARGVTATSVIALAKRTRARFLLLGRSSVMEEPEWCHGIADEATLRRVLMERSKAAGDRILPARISREVRQLMASREIKSTLEALDSAGASARYLNIDICDAASLKEALGDVRREWGPITGLIHGAGVLADKLIADKTLEQFDEVFETKVSGLRALLAATEPDPLRHIVLFSSIAARCGNAGQCDYSMANEVLNKIAIVESKRRSAMCQVQSLNWGPWDGGMVTPTLRVHFQKLGVPLVPLDQGAAMFVEELCAGPINQVEVVLGADPEAGGLSGADR